MRCFADGRKHNAENGPAGVFWPEGVIVPEFIVEGASDTAAGLTMPDANGEKQPLHGVKALAGHSSVETTAKYHTKARDADSDLALCQADARAKAIAG